MPIKAKKMFQCVHVKDLYKHKNIRGKQSCKKFATRLKHFLLLTVSTFQNIAGISGKLRAGFCITMIVNDLRS